MIIQCWFTSKINFIQTKYITVQHTWFVAKKNRVIYKCPCVVHTILEITDVQKRIHDHNHPPTYTKNQLERERCVEAILLHEMSVKNAFNTCSINHPRR